MPRKPSPWSRRAVARAMRYRRVSKALMFRCLPHRITYTTMDAWLRGPVVPAPEDIEEVARVLDVPAEALASCAAWDKHRAALTRAYWDRRWGTKS